MDFLQILQSFQWLGSFTDKGYHEPEESRGFIWSRRNTPLPLFGACRVYRANPGRHNPVPETGLPDSYSQSAPRNQTLLEDLTHGEPTSLDRWTSQDSDHSEYRSPSQSTHPDPSAGRWSVCVCVHLFKCNGMCVCMCVHLFRYDNGVCVCICVCSSVQV